jgi:predicted membrane protein
MMKGVKRGQIRFIFWILISLFFVLYVFSLSLKHEIFAKLVYIFIFFMTIFIFVGFSISFYYRFKKVKYMLKIKKEKEKNVKDFYRYERTIDPPDFKLNN